MFGFKNLSLSKQIGTFAPGGGSGDSEYHQSLRGDSDFKGIFSGRPPSHSGFLKINGINRTVTSSTQIQILGRCDTLRGMTCQLHERGSGPARGAGRRARGRDCADGNLDGRAILLVSECSVFCFKGSGVRAAQAVGWNVKPWTGKARKSMRKTKRKIGGRQSLGNQGSSTLVKLRQALEFFTLLPHGHQAKEFKWFQMISNEFKALFIKKS